eukprot:146759-Rhodomonas_salina.2
MPEEGGHNRVFFGLQRQVIGQQVQLLAGIQPLLEPEPAKLRSNLAEPFLLLLQVLGFLGGRQLHHGDSPRLARHQPGKNRVQEVDANIFALMLFIQVHKFEAQEETPVVCKLDVSKIPTKVAEGSSSARQLHRTLLAPTMKTTLALHQFTTALQAPHFLPVVQDVCLDIIVASFLRNQAKGELVPVSVLHCRPPTPCYFPCVFCACGARFPASLPHHGGGKSRGSRPVQST